MYKHFITKKYWLRVSANFLWVLFLYSIISYFFREAGKDFWSLQEIQSRSVFAVFMALIFAYRQPNADAENEEEPVKKKWTLKEFFSVFGLLFSFSIIIMCLLFGIAWIVLQFFADNHEPTGKIFLKMILVTGTMCLLAVFVLFLSDRFGIRWQRS
jgi:cytochrome bd-type quinol oxidase subunit 2